MKWITNNSRIEKLSEANKWRMIDNELFQDEDGSIYLTPRNYETDNYTIPAWVAWLGGNKSKWDVRPSHFHDFGCQFHALIKVCMNEQTLRTKRLLRVKDDKIVCENIPIKFLKVEKKNKWFIDCMFKRMMKVANNIPSWRINLMRTAVFFNVGWSANYYNDIDLNQLCKANNEHSGT